MIGDIRHPLLVKNSNHRCVGQIPPLKGTLTTIRRDAPCHWLLQNRVLSHLKYAGPYTSIFLRSSRY